MAGQDELAQLEAERDRLLSMIDYQKRSGFQIDPWSRVVIGVICGIAALGAMGLFSGQIALSHVIFAVVFLGLTAYILTRKVTLFGVKVLVCEIDTLLGAGAPEAHRRLADCEAQIMKLQERRS
jgi:hypothetical protein